MKTKEEIEQLAKEEIERYRISTSSIDKPKEIQRFNGFIKGYTQCQEDMTEIMLIFEEIWQQMNGKTDESGDMIYVPPILRQKIKQTRLI